LAEHLRSQLPALGNQDEARVETPPISEPASAEAAERIAGSICLCRTYWKLAIVVLNRISEMPKIYRRNGGEGAQLRPDDVETGGPVKHGLEKLTKCGVGVIFITSINQSGMISGGVALPDSRLRISRLRITRTGTTSKPNCPIVP
jgi:hypothetical protein